MKQNETDFKQQQKKRRKKQPTKLIYGWQSHLRYIFTWMHVIKVKYNEFCEWWYMHVV